MHLSDVYLGRWVEQEEILFRVTAGNPPDTKNSPSSNDGLFASSSPLNSTDAVSFGGVQWMLVVRRYYQLEGASAVFDPVDVLDSLKL